MQTSFFTALVAVLAAGASASPLPLVQTVELSQRDLFERDSRSGAMTYYQVGLGSCGQDDTGKDNLENIVAMSPDMVGTGGDSNCGRKIHIKGKDGQVVSATVRDKCPSCSPGEIDVSEKVFKEIVGDLGVGRSKVSWTWAN
ncbi:hypothetical protein OQA88_5250 [Cercophora sp. LCS_1]